MIDYIPGLEKVPAAQSKISFIDGQKGILEYRGIRIEELAEHSTFEEVAYLLINGALPTQSQLDEFTSRIRAARALSPELRRLVEDFPPESHPMAALQTCVSAMGMYMAPSVKSEEEREARAIEFIGKFPTLVAAAHRVREGKDIIDPDTSLNRAADFLRMITGEKPDDFGAYVLNVSLILHADHTMNASTFAARVTASTESEPAAAVAAAVGSLSGPLHGGANERVLIMLEKIGSKENVAAWVEQKLARREKIMGLGHRVYKTKDPRATILQKLAHEMFEQLGTSPFYESAVEIEKCTEENLGKRGIYPNVDFYSGIVYNKLGIPSDLFTPIFAVSRIAGWMAHWLEQMRDNRLFRPTQRYTGEREVSYVPIGERKEQVSA